MQSQIIKIGLIAGGAVAAVLAGSYATLQSTDLTSAPPPQITAAAPDTTTGVMPIDPRIVPPPGQGAPPPMPIPHAVPMTDGPILPQNAPPPMTPTYGGGIDPRAYEPTGGSGPSAMPPWSGPDPSAPPPTPRRTGPSAMPPAAAGDPPAGGSAPPSDSKVLSYFQQTKTQINTKDAFGFVLIPRAAVTAEEKRSQKDFCEIVLASMDFMTPGAVAAAAEHHDILATYWPIDSARNSFEVSAAFGARDCGDLIAWYDHKLARSLAARAGVSHLGGPMLMTWPSSGASEEDRNPLVVDFSKANHERATKALQYWFRQLRNKPSLWTSRIREGTIRAELADAVNDTAGVMLAVLYGKWDTLNAVGATATP